MWKTILLILPVLVPSWRFFQSVQPSPRIEWRVVQGVAGAREVWHPNRPRPQNVPLTQIIRRLFWNPFWNETLFMMSLAERICENPTDHSLRQLKKRLLVDIGSTGLVNANAQFQFRLVLIDRQDDVLNTDVVFVSDVFGPQGMPV